MTLTPTITPQEAAEHPWDAVVVGAGPAGGMCSLLLARRGWQVLLVDRSSFPREKLCGCCLGAAGAELLRQHGLAHVLTGGTPLRHAEFRLGRRSVDLRLAGGFALTRAQLDSRIASAAASSGAAFLPACTAKLGIATSRWREIELQSDSHNPATLRAGIVLACDGLRGTLLDDEPSCQWRVARDSWMGAAMTIEQRIIAPGEILMHCGTGGYVGGVALPDGRSHLAAAMDPAVAKSVGGPLNLMTRILRDCGTPVDTDGIQVAGTGLLTRKRECCGARRILAVGDACAYIEPFTGEGMTWALRSAELLAQLLPASLEAWPDDTPAQWGSVLQAALWHEQLICRTLRYLLHRPMLASAAIRMTGALPEIGEAIVRMISGSSTRELTT